MLSTYRTIELKCNILPPPPTMFLPPPSTKGWCTFQPKPTRSIVYSMHVAHRWLTSGLHTRLTLTYHTSHRSLSLSRCHPFPSGWCRTDWALTAANNIFGCFSPTESKSQTDGSRGRARDLHQAPCLPQPLQQGQGGEDARRKARGALPQEVRQGPPLRRLQHLASWGKAAAVQEQYVV